MHHISYPKHGRSMIFDLTMLRQFYADYSQRVNMSRKALGHPMTLAEKILYAHLYRQQDEKALEQDALKVSPTVRDNGNVAAQESIVPAQEAAALTNGVTEAAGTAGCLREYKRGTDYADFRPDRVAMQDATAQMALLQFMNAGRREVAVPTTVHCDHLIQASDGAAADLSAAESTNAEVYDFLRSASACYGIGFWRPGSGIIHQVVLENYSFPGGMMVGTDSHTPNAGGMTMLAIGVGGADAVDVMTGMPWELKMPRLIGVRLTGRLSGWASPKDVILKLAGMLTVKGATNAIIEYFGEGTATLSCTGRATICNMGAELGATTSIFPYDEAGSRYLAATGREEVALMADGVARELRADAEVEARPTDFYDEVVEIDLNRLTPYVNGPFTPDAATPAAEMAAYIAAGGYPDEISTVLIGSCTNSSYQDLVRAAAVLRAGLDAGLSVKTELIINPGSERIRATAERDGLLPLFRRAGAVIMANACGPCIGQWKRKTDDPTRRNSIITTFNRNFAKRADGNPNTCAFITSPEAAIGYAFSGRLSEHPACTAPFKSLMPPPAADLPPLGFAAHDAGYVPPVPGSVQPVIKAGSERLQRLAPFAPWDGRDFDGLRLLIKARGKCTTDHISMAGPWLKYRGHLENISRNLLMGAVNAFNGRTNAVRNALTGEEETVSATAAAYRDAGLGSIVVAEENYGEGSSREHAAMEPRFLGVKVILAKSFARIHETNLKKQGVLALTFKEPSDYDRIREDDTFHVACAGIMPGVDITLTVRHADGTAENITARHTYNAQQLKWLRAGSALNAG